MRIVVALLALPLTGCVSVADVRAKPVMFSGATDKLVNTVAACVTSAVQSGPGVLVTSVPLEQGISIIQSAYTPQGITPFIIIDITEVSGKRLIEIRANGRTPKDPAKNFKPIADCL